MTVLISSQTAAAVSAGTALAAGEVATLTVTNGMGNGEVRIEISTATDTWTGTGEVLSHSQPTKIINGPLTFRVSKPESPTAYAVEMF